MKLIRFIQQNDLKDQDVKFDVISIRYKTKRTVCAALFVILFYFVIPLDGVSPSHVRPVAVTAVITVV